MTVSPGESARGVIRDAEVPEAWVPVDRRWFGLDRRTVLPALVVLGWALAMSLIVPVAVQLATPPAQRVRAGDTIALAGDVVFVPATGWTLADGVLAGQEPNTGYPDSATVTSGPVTFAVQTGPFTGTPEDLLQQLATSSGAGPGRPRSQATRTTDGNRGVVARVGSETTDGLIATYVIDGTGVEVMVTGPAELANPPTREVATMLASIAQAEEPQ